jgi:hypothetical protein
MLQNICTGLYMQLSFYTTMGIDFVGALGLGRPLNDFRWC